MNQMKAPQARVIGRVPYETVASGFMREGNGEIFLLLEHGRATIKWPVLEDGTVLNKGEVEYPGCIVELVNPADLGITAIRWTQPA